MDTVLHDERTQPVRIAHCGLQDPLQITRENDGGVVVLRAIDGSEVLYLGQDREVHLAEGMFVLWNSARSIRFAQGGGRLHRMSLPIPEAELLRRMPRMRDLMGRPISQQGAGGLFLDCLRSLMQHFAELPAASREPALDTTLDLLGVCLHEQPELPPPRLRRFTLQQVQRHIEKHLTDPELGVASLAGGFCMSQRNIHKLFAGTGTTVCAYIRDRRLAMCRRDLASRSLMARHVGEIARHWGFVDPSHFSKLFRAVYGVSPSEWRARARAGTMQKEPAP
jgi:AraC-like DNA-binding protein